MYNYELKNNHILIIVDGKKYLLDTGSPNSFWTIEPIKSIAIDNRNYQLDAKPSNLDLEEAFKTIGTKVDGFIGLDIVKQTSLTIYKNNTIEFKANDEKGMRVPMDTFSYLTINVECKDHKGKMIIDTGAMFAYGVYNMFRWSVPCGYGEDYNPFFKKMGCDLFECNIYVNEKRFLTYVGRNERVSELLTRMGVILIGGINSFFKEVCVIDIHRKELVLR